MRRRIGQLPIIRRYVPWTARPRRRRPCKRRLPPITVATQSVSRIFSPTYRFDVHPAIHLSPYFQSDEIVRSSIREPIQPSRHTGPRRATFACDGMSAGTLTPRPAPCGSLIGLFAVRVNQAARKAFLNAPLHHRNGLSTRERPAVAGCQRDTAANRGTEPDRLLGIVYLGSRGQQVTGYLRRCVIRYV
jgi:hypothetical protein